MTTEELVAGKEKRTVRSWCLKDAWLLEPQKKTIFAMSPKERLKLAFDWKKAGMKEVTADFRAWKLIGSGYEHLEVLHPEVAQTTSGQDLILLASCGAASGRAFEVHHCGENVVQLHTERFGEIEEMISRAGLSDQTGIRLLRMLKERCHRRVLEDIEDIFAGKAKFDRADACTGCGNCSMGEERPLDMYALRALSTNPALIEEAVVEGKIDYNIIKTVPHPPMDDSQLKFLPSLVTMTKRRNTKMRVQINQAEQHYVVPREELCRRLFAAMLRNLLVAKLLDQMSVEVRR
jgi:hypothetical protein